MSRIVRLRVKLLDETGTFEEGRTRKIIYGLNVYKHLLIRDVRQDLSIKLGINAEEHDLEIWVDEYLVPGYTSSLVFKDDEEILVKVVPKGANNQEETVQAFADDALASPVIPEESRTASEDTGSQPADTKDFLTNGAGKSTASTVGFRKSGTSTPTASKIMATVGGHFQKPAMQCFHWDSNTHVKTNCKFWHPRELCKNYPMCTHGASTCGFAHPFCGEFCECHPHAKDPQKNHRVRQQKPSTPGPTLMPGMVAMPPPNMMEMSMNMFNMG